MTKKRQKHTPFSANSSAQPPLFDRKLARRDARQLGLHKADLPNSIKEVIATLNEAGFEAYIVGGGVRDALLGLKPKDFDAVTNATPNQIKEVFGKRCRIIGRRFLLCHVYSGRDMIEVATFRAPPKDDTHLTEDGMIMRDNVWGDIFQDVVRRDFSINAMYYQPLEGFVYDFCGGLNDIKNRTIRLLGDTQKRIEEDPVRLLRALRFKAKLGFDFDDALQAQFNPQNWALLRQVSPHRLYDETQKMFTGGYLIPLLPLLFEYQAIEHLLFYPPSMITPLLEQVTQNTDKRIGQGKSINPAFFYAALLWENYLYLLDKLKKNSPFAEAQVQAANKVMDKQRPFTAMPKFAEQFIKDIWLMQPRLAEPRKKNLVKLFENPRFRAGFDFLMLREQVEAKNRVLSTKLEHAVTLDNEPTNGMGHWWAWFQTLNAKQQQKAIDEFDINAVQVRFANLVNGNSIIPSDTPNTPISNRRERRAQKRLAQQSSSAYLTEQEQQEKDQLQLLSLANDTPINNAPAQPLWGTPFNHQVAETEVVTQPFSQHEPQDRLQDTLSPDTRPNDQASRPKNNVKSAAQAKRKRDEATTDYQDAKNDVPKTTRKTISHNMQPHAHLTNAQIPHARKRRVPSSDLSVLEQRALAQSHTKNQADSIETSPSADIQVERTAQICDVLAVDPAKIPTKRTRKKVVENTQTVITQIKDTAQTLENSPKKPPVKRGRKPKAVTEAAIDSEVSDSEVSLVEQNLIEPKTKKIPVKRTRKNVVKTNNTNL